MPSAKLKKILTNSFKNDYSVQQIKVLWIEGFVMDFLKTMRYNSLGKNFICDKFYKFINFQSTS